MIILLDVHIRLLFNASYLYGIVTNTGITLHLQESSSGDMSLNDEFTAHTNISMSRNSYWHSEVNHKIGDLEHEFPSAITLKGVYHRSRRSTCITNKEVNILPEIFR
jgi:hypothetical protein